MKYIKQILLCVITGIFMGFFLYSGYENKKDILPVFKEGEPLTFLRMGIYDNEDTMKKNTQTFANYIYLIKENKYYVYIGMFKKKDSVNKVKEFYRKKGYIVDEETFTISHKEFLKVIEKYEEMLSSTSDDKVIENIINGILSKYEELIPSG